MQKTLLISALPFLLAGCADAPSMLDPAGPEAAAIADTWWVMFWGGVAILALVMGLALGAVFRRPGGWAPRSDWLIVGGGLLMPVVLLTGLLIYGLVVSVPPGPENPLTIRVIGHQWWWEVHYPQGGRVAITANEIHVPAGRDLRLELHSADVIHSFWVPQLGGKRDLIPGRANRLELRAEAPGLYHGQCAEFCGAQHAHMRLLVVARPEDEFHAWLARQHTPAPEPATPIERRGRERFFARGCDECHTVRGTPARGRDGPDLTHVGGRRTLGAGTLENRPGAIARWITEHHRLKPGNRMERFDHLPSEEVEAIAAWLERVD